MDLGKRWNHFDAEKDQACLVAVHLPVAAHSVVVPAAVHSPVVISVAVDCLSVTS